jgi:signal transduction histidine kinase
MYVRTCKMDQVQTLLREQHQIHAKIASGIALEESLNEIVCAVSRLRPGATGIILLAHDTGEILIRSHSPHIAAAVASAIRVNGRCNQPAGFSDAHFYCSTPAICRDVLIDDGCPAAWRELCIAHKIRAFCSSPILDGERTAAGSVMLCFDRAQEADPWDQYVARYASSIAGVAVAQERMARALRQQAEKFRQSEELAVVGRLSASIAHEINNPLTAVVNLLYLLSQEDSLSESAQSYVRTAQSELRRVSQITTETLKFYKQRRMTERCSVAEIIQGLLSLYKVRLEQARVSLQFREYPAAPILCHAGELRQVFANLLTNALDALAPGGGLVRVKVRSGTVWKRGVPGVRITIADNGQGMDRATRGRIYEALFTTKNAVGTGLGLWISSEIVNKHGGTIFVRSQSGRGTAFTIALPEDGPQESAAVPKS